MKNIPKTGELYKDFTNKVYQVVAVAVYAETGEQIVVYQAMSGDYGVYARSLQQFTGEDHRQPLFQKIERPGSQPGNTEEAQTGYLSGNTEEAQTGYLSGNAETQTGYLSGNTEKAQAGYLSGNKKEAKTGYLSGNTEEIGIGSQSENAQEVQTGSKPGNTGGFPAGRQLTEAQQRNRMHLKTGEESVYRPVRQSGNSRRQEQQPGFVSKIESRPRTQSPAESKRVLRQSAAEASGEEAYYYEKRRRQMEEREQRREMFRKSERHESATEELRANPCLIKFLEADTYEEKFQVLNEIQNDMTDRLIDDIAVVLDVVIPEGALNDRFYQLRNIILTRQKYETNRFR